ncbi:MAG: hypothetical protein QG608_2108 [Actinomycetota bacterium]|nr:hypothetical protein [Actinomycetota bacterium]
MLEAAERLKVSQARVRQLYRSGRLQGRKVSDRILLDEVGLNRPAARSRPMSHRMAWGLIAVLSHQEPVGLLARERLRLGKAGERLKTDADPASWLRSWLPARAKRLSFSVDLEDIPSLRADPRILLSGISDPRAGLSTGGEIEGYLHPADLPGLVEDYLMSGVGRNNAFLHLHPESPSPVPLGLVLADLADHNGPREDAKVNSLLQEHQ